MMDKELTVKEKIYKAYANLAMAHSALTQGKQKYSTVNYMIRNKRLKGLKDVRMKMGSFFDDEKIKALNANYCAYCGISGDTQKLSLDHIIPKKLGGEDSGENLLPVCRSCNSSKSSKDLIEWLLLTKKKLPLMVIRRYIKCCITIVNSMIYLNILFMRKAWPTSHFA